MFRLVRSSLFIFTALVFFVACSSTAGTPSANPSPSSPSPTDPGAAPVTPHASQPALLASYFVLREHSDGKTERQVDRILYQPYDAFGSWDKLSWPSWHYRDSMRADWLNFVLNRDAIVAVVWDGDELPSWLNESWSEGAKKDDRRTFTKAFPAGAVSLGAAEGKGYYYVLLGEADGTASVKPVAPEGKELPVANTQCPTWVHDQYVTTAPDGKIYKTWHPQIDPVYWCYFGHEHGSDPSVMNYSPYYDYVAFHNSRQNEQHEGFKGFVVQDGSVNWYVNIHATTGMIARACVDLHTVVFAATNAEGELIAELAYKGDFGETKANTGDNALITNPNCDQAVLAAEGTRAEKRLRVINEAGYQDSGYEKWRMIGRDFLGLEFNSDHITIDIRNPVTGCNGIVCQEGILTNIDKDNPTKVRNHGERRTIHFQNGIKLVYNKELDEADGKIDGFFFTNAKGTALAQEGEEGALRQYIKPGLNIAGPSGFHGTQDAWQAIYEKDSHKIPGLELEDGLGALN